MLGYILVVPGVVSAGLGIFQLCNLGGAKAEVLPQLVAVGVVAIILGIWNIAAGVVISSFGATLSSLTEIGQAVLSCVASQARR